MYYTILIQSTFTLGSLFGEDVTFECFLMCDLSGSSNLEAFFRTGIRFYFRHYYAFIFYTLLADLHRQITCWALRAIRSKPEMGRKIMDLYGEK